MIDPVTKSGFLASTSMATIDDESNAEDVQRPCPGKSETEQKLPFGNLEKNMLNGRSEHATAAYCNESYGRLQDHDKQMSEMQAEQRALWPSRVWFDNV